LQSYLQHESADKNHFQNDDWKIVHFVKTSKGNGTVEEQNNWDIGVLHHLSIDKQI